VITQLRQSLGTVPWHSLAIVWVFVFTVWTGSSVHPMAGIRSMAIALTATVAGILLVWLRVRDIRRSGLIVTGLLLILASKALAAFVADAYPRLGPQLTVAFGLLVLLAVALALRIGWKLARRSDIGRMHRRLNVFAAMLVVVSVASFIPSGHADQVVGDLGDPAEPPPADPTISDAAPDIFIVMLDGYPRQDVLRARMDFDNSPFIGALESRGFEVADEALSPYMWTHLSLSSLLNADYVEHIPELADVSAGRRRTHPAVRAAIDTAGAVDIARQLGYTTVAMSSGYEQTAMRGADRWVDDPYLSEFELRLLESSFVSDLINVVAPDFASAQHRDRIISELELLPEIAGEAHANPRFVLAHLPAPHQPAVMDADGEPIAVPITADFYGDSSVEREIPVDQFIGEFTGQLLYLNHLVLDSIDGIVEAADEPPVIIVMSDHGSASETNWRATTLAEEDQAAVLERTGILFAAFTPGHDGVFPEDIGPPDVLRHLFNAYLGTDLPPAEPPIGGIQIPRVSSSVLDPEP
jgi:hypothetical protein